MGWARESFAITRSRACGLMLLERSSFYYQAHPRDNRVREVWLKELAAVRVRYGYRRLTILLRREGWLVNTKRVYRIYRQENLSVCTKVRERHAVQSRVQLGAGLSLTGKQVIDCLERWRNLQPTFETVLTSHRSKTAEDAFGGKDIRLWYSQLHTLCRFSNS